MPQDDQSSSDSSAGIELTPGQSKSVNVVTAFQRAYERSGACFFVSLILMGDALARWGIFAKLTGGS